MSENKWDVFASTGKITDYLEYKGIKVGTTTANGEENACGIENDNTQGTGNTGISCG